MNALVGDEAIDRLDVVLHKWRVGGAQYVADEFRLSRTVGKE